MNPARFHKQHERFYAASPIEGVLFMEGQGRPAELSAMIGDLRDATALAGAADWLAAHMQSLAATLLDRAADMLERVELVHDNERRWRVSLDALSRWSPRCPKAGETGRT